MSEDSGATWKYQRNLQVDGAQGLCACHIYPWVLQGLCACHIYPWVLYPWVLYPWVLGTGTHDDTALQVWDDGQTGPTGKVEYSYPTLLQSHGECLHGLSEVRVRVRWVNRTLTGQTLTLGLLCLT